MIAIVLSSIALLAAITAVVFVVIEINRNRKQNAVIEKEICNLKSGITPDYEAAKEAAKAVNEFNAGITSILGFDPYTAIQAKRNEDKEVDRN